MGETMKLIKQLAVIMTISFLAELMEILIPLPIAASVYGLVLMLGGLMTKIIPLEKVEDAADFLIEIMPVLFVPPTVGLIANVEALKQMVVPLFVISATTTVLIMAVTGRVSQSIIRRSHSTPEGAADLSGEEASAGAETGTMGESGREEQRR